MSDLVGNPEDWFSRITAHFWLVSRGLDSGMRGIEVDFCCCFMSLINVGPGPLEPKEIDGLLVPPSKAYTLLTYQLITGKLLRSRPAQEKWFQVKPSIHKSLFGLLGYFSSTFCVS